MSLKEAAIALATGRGWEVFPLRPKKKVGYKNAATSNGRRWGATRDPDEIERDFTKWPRANVGLPTGPSNGIFVLDADTLEKHGQDGVGNLRRLEAQHGELATLTAVSPSGSVHKYFRWPEGLEVRNSTSRVADGIDVRGDGGMVVCPPSLSDGAAYRWEDPEAEVAEAPRWLLELVAEEARGTVGGDPFSSGANMAPVDDAEIAAAVAAIPNAGEGGWDAWNRVGLALWRATEGSELGLELFDEWSKKHAEKYDAGETIRRWHVIGTSPPSRIGVGTILWLADQADPSWRAAHAAREAVPDRMAEAEEGEDARVARGELKLSDFWANLESHQYIYAPTGSMWPPASVNGNLGKVAIVDRAGEPVRDEEGDVTLVPAATWLDMHRPVHQVVWAPGHPQIIPGRHLLEGGWVSKKKASVYNMYRPPLKLEGGDPQKAERWLEHGRKLYGDQADHMVLWAAHRVQQPGSKVNHCVVMLGSQGIGKDTWLEPLKHAVGPWNFSDITPLDILSPYSGYLQATVVRINEARDLGDVNRYQFHERTKVMMAAPPDVLRVNEKYTKERAVLNCCGVVVTTNRLDSLYLPEDDRRHYVAHSDLTKDDYEAGYWTDLWRYYDEGGFLHVGAYLATLDLSQFDAKAPPPRTEAFWQIVDASRSSELPEMATVLQMMGDPDALTAAQLADRAAEVPALSSFYDWLTDRKNQKARPRVMAEAGYVAVKNPDSQSGLWSLSTGERAVVYSKASLPLASRVRAAAAVARGAEQPSEPPGPRGGGTTVTPMVRPPTRRRRES